MSTVFGIPVVDLRKPKDRPAKRKKANHCIRNKRRTKRGMVIDLDKAARQEIVVERDAEICQRCGASRWIRFDIGPGKYIEPAVIQWAHIHTREYYITRWEPDNSLALCSRCHVWFDNHKVLGFNWFAKKFPERWERITRLLQVSTKTNDAWVRELWERRTQ